jgi:hypothetical protein
MHGLRVELEKLPSARMRVPLDLGVLGAARRAREAP